MLEFDAVDEGGECPVSELYCAKHIEEHCHCGNGAWITLQ